MAKRKRRKGAVFGEGALGPVYLTQYEVTYEPLQEPAYRRLPKVVKEQLERLHDEAQKNPREAIPKLLELKRKYPRVPQIYNYLAVAYSSMGEMEKAEEITQENMRRNPKYLFAKINQAQFYLKRGEYDKIPALFDNKYDLQMLYPGRKRFHIAEVANFMGIMGLYFAKSGQREVAEKYNKILQEIAPEYPIARQLDRELNPGLAVRMLKRLLGEQDE